MRVLHLIHPDAADAGPCTVRLLADVVSRMNDVQHAVVSIGNGSNLATAKRCVIANVHAIGSSRLTPWAAAPALRTYARTCAIAGKRFDLVHAWSLQTAALVCLAFRSALPSISTLHVPPRDDLASMAQLFVVRRSSKHRMLMASASVRRGYRAAGLPNERLTMMPTAVHAAGDSLTPRNLVRARFAELHDEPIDDGVFIIALMGEPAETCDANLAATIAARVILSGRRAKLLVHPAAARRMQAMRLLSNLSLEHSLIVDETVAEPWQILGGVDAALFVSGKSNAAECASGLPVLWAMAAGVPTVAQTCGWSRDLIDHGKNGLLYDATDINGAADHLARIHDAPSLRETFANENRTIVHDMFDIDAYCERLKHAYELLIAERTAQFDAQADSSAQHAEEALTT